jgi:hypothetical protein
MRLLLVVLFALVSLPLGPASGQQARNRKWLSHAERYGRAVGSTCGSTPGTRLPAWLLAGEGDRRIARPPGTLEAHERHGQDWLVEKSRPAHAKVILRIWRDRRYGGGLAAAGSLQQR